MMTFSDSELANLGVFGNYVSVSWDLEELKSFVEEIQKYIQISRVHLEGQKQGYSEFEAKGLKYKYELTYPEILRRSTIISTTIILENSLDIYCNHYKKHDKSLLGVKDLKGDLLGRFKVYSQKVINLNFNFSSKMWQNINSIYELRNCIVHNNGSLINFGKSSVIKEFVKTNSYFKINGSQAEGCEILEITFDGCIYCIETIENFFLELSYLAFERFPGHYRGFRKKRLDNY